MILLTLILVVCGFLIFFFKQKTAYEMRISDWSSDVCSSDLAAMMLTQVLYKKIDLTMALNGAIAGLVSITAGPDLQNHFMALIIGGIGGALVVFAVPLMDKLKIDDVVGALSAHLVAGIWGTQIGRALFRERGCQNV